MTARPVPSANGTYTITPDLGRQAGGNLFYSFGAFSLATGQTANFTGTPLKPVQDVFVRVTGSQASAIDGTLACTFANAGFFFMNPSGMTFTANASLNLRGSFALTTADYVQFADGTQFAAANAAPGAALSPAAPAAFGFSSSATAGITVNAAVLQVPAGASILAVGGAVGLSGGVLAAPSGRVGIVSTASAGTVSFDSSTLAPAAITTPVLDAVTLASDGAISTAGLTGGPVSVQCASLTLTGGAFIDSSTMGPGTGGAVTVSASGKVVVSGSDSSGNDSVISALSSPSASGNAGSINITAGALQLLGGGFLSTSTYGMGNSGNINASVSGQALLSGADPSGNEPGSSPTPTPAAQVVMPARLRSALAACRFWEEQ